jgi:hypothetical protein
MSLPASFAICCVLIAGGLYASQRSLSPRQYDEWLQAKYTEATSVKVGMTRADLIKVFRIDGGLQQMIPTRYVLKGTSLIKVEVEFEKLPDSKKVLVPEDLKYETEEERERYQYIPNDQLKIKTISTPYLEPFNYD